LRRINRPVLAEDKNLTPKDFQTPSSVKSRKIVTSSWQRLELARFLKENARNPALNSKTVFLANLKEKKQIDRIIEAYLWPGVINALVGTPIRVSEGKEGFPTSLLQDEEKIYTTRSLTFVLEDADRPFLPREGPPWFCRRNIECSVLAYMTSFDFYAHLPIDFDLDKVIELLSDPSLSAILPIWS
jgi:hypothetical protein